jgi:hypothetical protein
LSCESPNCRRQNTEVWPLDDVRRTARLLKCLEQGRAQRRADVSLAGHNRRESEACEKRRGNRRRPKAAVQPLGSVTGKSGGFRAIYAYFERFDIVVMITAYKKGRKDDISAAEKKIIRKLMTEIEKELNARGGIR